MSGPTYDVQTLAAYFQPIHPETWEDPVVGPALRSLALTNPAVIEAVGDVDRSQIMDSLAIPPMERLSRALSLAAFIERTRERLANGIKR